jgi:hypothetical protein
MVVHDMFPKSLCVEGLAPNAAVFVDGTFGKALTSLMDKTFGVFII